MFIIVHTVKTRCLSQESKCFTEVSKKNLKIRITPMSRNGLRYIHTVLLQLAEDLRNRGIRNLKNFDFLGSNWKHSYYDQIGR